MHELRAKLKLEKLDFTRKVDKFCSNFGRFYEILFNGNIEFLFCGSGRRGMIDEVRFDGF